MAENVRWITAAEAEATFAPIGGGSPGGEDTQVQFNDSGSFGGNAALTFDSVNQKLTVKAKTSTAANSIEVMDKDGVMRVGILGSDFHGNADVAVYGGDGSYGAEISASFNDATIFVFDNTTGGSLALGGLGRIFSYLGSDGVSGINIQRFTDTSPTGNFMVCNDAQGNPVFAVDINGIVAGKGNALVFPDADPHVAGAAYWVAGVLTKSTG